MTTIKHKKQKQSSCCLSNCVCLKHGPEFKHFAAVTRHKFRTELLTTTVMKCNYNNRQKFN